MTTKYWVAVPSDGVYQVFYETIENHLSNIALETGSQYAVTYDHGADPYLIRLEGLASGGKMTNLSGGVALAILTSPAQLETVTCLHGTGNTIALDAQRGNLNVVRQLAAEIAVQLGFDGTISVERVLSGANEHIGFISQPSILSASVYAFLSDWTDETLGGLAGLSLDELIYKEV